MPLEVINYTETQQKRQEDNKHSERPGKFSNTYFRIDKNGYDGSGREAWPLHIRLAFVDEVRKIFAAHGWTIAEPSVTNGCDTATKGRSHLYLHPQNFSGVCKNSERATLYEAFAKATTFVCRAVDVYEEIHDMTDEQLVEHLNGKRDVIEAGLLVEFTTKRRNLFITSPNLQGAVGNISKQHCRKRLAIDGKTSRYGIDDRTAGICYEFTYEAFSALVANGNIVIGKTRHGLGYRTATAADLAKKLYYEGNNAV